MELSLANLRTRELIRNKKNREIKVTRKFPDLQYTLHAIMMISILKSLTLRESSLFGSKLGALSKCKKKYLIVITENLTRSKSLSCLLSARVNEICCLCERFHRQNIYAHLMALFLVGLNNSKKVCLVNTFSRCLIICFSTTVCYRQSKNYNISP